MSVIPQTHSVVLLTYRPEYHGPLTNLTGAQTISLSPLTGSETSALLGELLGTDPSIAAIAGLVAGRAAGNPFFAQEMVRELAGRGVLEGERGRYTCRTDVAEISVPATLQAAIAARIDRLDPRSETDHQRRGGYRIAVHPRPAHRVRGGTRSRRADQRGPDRPGTVHAVRGIRLPASGDPHGRLRIAAEILSGYNCIGDWPAPSNLVSRPRRTRTRP